MTKIQIITNNLLTMDLFEDLRKHVGCMYISDLRLNPYKRTAKKAIQSFDLGKYSLWQLSDMAQYLYDKELVFDHLQQANQFFGYQRKKRGMNSND